MILFKVFMGSGMMEWDMPNDSRRVMLNEPLMLGYNWEEDGETHEVLINLENVDGYEVVEDE